MLSLEGVRVLDLTPLLPGPFASQALVDLGAEVIKVERPGGDPIRQMHPGMYRAVNRGKKSIELDLTTDDDRDVLRRLAQSADVFLEGFRPGVMEKLGFGFDDVRKIRPDIIYVSLTGWGLSGPSRDEPGHDANYLARSGAIYLTIPSSGEPSAPHPIPIADLSSALFGVIGILAALRQEPRRAVHLDVSLFASSLALMAPRFGAIASDSDVDHQMFARSAAHGIYRTGDGKYLSLAAIEGHFWRRLCTALNCEDLLTDDRPAEYGVAKARLDEAFMTKSRDEWVEILRQNDVPVAPVLAPSEVPNDPQVRHLGYFDSWPDVSSFLPIAGLELHHADDVDPLDGHGQQIRDHGWEMD